MSAFSIFTYLIHLKTELNTCKVDYFPKQIFSQLPLQRGVELHLYFV